MAILPNPDELARVTPQPSTSVAGYQSGIVGGAEGNLANSKAGLANSEVGFGQNLTQMADAETQKLDTMKANDAETQLMQKELELKTQYNAVKGGDVLTPDFNSNSSDNYKAATQAITDGLSTNSQKAQFQQIAARRGVAFDAGRTAYAMGETDKFNTIQHNARVQVITDTAASQYANPDAVAANNAALNDEVVKWGVSQGMSDPAIAAAMHKETNGNFYTALIDKALVNNDNSTANTLYAASSRFLSDAQNQNFSNRLKVANAFSDGQRIAAEGNAALASGTSLAQVQLDMAKKSAPLGAETYNAAMSVFNNVQQANVKAQEESLGSAMMLYHSSGAPANAKVTVMASQQFQKLQPIQQAKVIDYMDADIQQHIQQQRSATEYGWAGQNHQWAAENHADAVVARGDAATARAEAMKYKTPQVSAAFYAAVSDPSLKDMSHAQIFGKYGETLGQTLTSKVIDEFDSVSKNVKPLSLDSDILEAAKPASLKKNSAEAGNDAFNGFVKSSLMDWQQQNPGKIPSPDQQRAIAASANSTYGESHWYTPSPKPAYEGPPDEWVKQLQASSLKVNKVPLTPAQVQSTWRRRSLQQVQGQ